MDFGTLIDPTTFEIVRRYRQSPRYSELQILFVRSDEWLARLAEFLADEDLQLKLPAVARLQFGAFVKGGAVKIGVEEPWYEKAEDPWHLVNIDAISDHADCRVIFQPPFYLVALPEVMREKSATAVAQ